MFHIIPSSTPIRGLTGHLHLLAILTWTKNQGVNGTKLEAQSRSRWILVIFHYWSSSHICHHFFRWTCVDHTNADPMPWTIGILVVCNMSKNARIFPQCLDKTLVAISRQMARGNEKWSELYDMYQAQGCPKVIHRKKMQRWAAWTFWPCFWVKLGGVRNLQKQIRGMKFVTGLQQTLWTWHQNIFHRTSIFLQPEWTWYW